MNIVITIIGRVLDICNNINAQYQLNKVKKECSYIGRGSYIPWPCTVKSSNSFSSNSEKNIYIGNNVSFGPGLIMYAIRAKITVKDNSFSGPNLTIMTGDHPYEFVGKFIKDNKKNQMEKANNALEIINPVLTLYEFNNGNKSLYNGAYSS